MNEMLVDTHVLIWMMEDNGKLSSTALQAIVSRSPTIGFSFPPLPHGKSDC